MAESQNIEYKQSWRDEYLKWICGFANASGGSIFIGKDDTGNVVGLSDSKRLMEEIPNKARDILGILIEVNLHTTMQGDYLEIIVEAHPYPVDYKGQYHQRSGATKQELTGTALDKFLLRKKGKRWDGVPMPGVSAKDLKSSTFDLFRKRAIKSFRLEADVLTDTNEELLENLQLKENGFLKRAAILLFHADPEKYVTGAFIKIGYFETDADLKYQDVIEGNIFDQIEKTMDLLFTKYMKSAITYEGIHRIETTEYPKEAIREALLNAIAHKDYAGCVPIQISVYVDKIIIWNEGHLPEDWTVQNLLEKHSSRPYNPDIANALFRSGYIESWGRGTIKIINECKKAGFPAPFFSCVSSDFTITFRKEIYTQKDLLALNLTERQIKAVLFIKEKGKITNADYQKLNEVSKATASRDLAEIVEKYQILERIGGVGAGTSYTLIGS